MELGKAVLAVGSMTLKIMAARRLVARGGGGRSRAGLHRKGDRNQRDREIEGHREIAGQQRQREKETGRDG